MAQYFSHISSTYFLLVLSILCLPYFSEGVVKRCFKCRSRGDLGSCKDPFLFTNATSFEQVAGVETIPCSSGWCGKVLEGGANSFKDEEYGMATERTCLLRGPSDSEERCAPTLRGNTRVTMCFCQGDLCNTASLPHISSLSLLLAPLVLLVMIR